MTRNEFVKICGVLGLSLPFQFGLQACEKEKNLKFKGKVIIIGAGAGGLSAAYLLKQQGIEVQVLEASNTFGGRMQIDTNFADFPIPLGAEWLETNTAIFDEIVNNSAVDVTIQTFDDSPDRKFINSSWFSFFEQYIYPSVANSITYNAEVSSIDYSADEIRITTQNNQYTADKVIVSVPLQILKNGDISFTPNLPQNKQSAINNVEVWAGFKTFIEFSTNFYGNDDVVIEDSAAGQKIFYDATLGQNTSKHILGLFTVGAPALAYNGLSQTQLKNTILSELDILFNNQASGAYVKHVSKNWQDEPFIKNGYLSDYANWRDVKTIGKSVENKLFFAGGEYTDGEDWVSVHTASQSARAATDAIMY